MTQGEAYTRLGWPLQRYAFNDGRDTWKAYRCDSCGYELISTFTHINCPECSKEMPQL